MQSSPRVPTWIVCSSSLVLLTLAAVSTGTLQDDDLTHLIFARDAWQSPRLFADPWGRPGFTLPYALVAWIGAPDTGWWLARCLSAALTIGTAALTAGVAARLLPAPGAVLATCAFLAMPLVARLALTTLTETIAAFYLALGSWLWTRGRPTTAAAVFALLPLARHEGLAIVALIGVGLLLQQRWAAAATVSWALVVWNIVTRAAFGYWPAATYLTAHPAAVGEYGAGSVTFYLIRWVEACGVAGVLATLLGMVDVARGGTHDVRRGESNDAVRGVSLNAMRVAGTWWMMTVGVAGFLALQTWLYLDNTRASGGYARFLVPMAPWMAVLAARGLLAASRRGVRWTAAVVAAGCTALLVSVLNDSGRLHALAERFLDLEGQALVARGLVGAAALLTSIAVVSALASLRSSRTLARAAAAVLLAAQAVHLMGALAPLRLGAREQHIKSAVTHLTTPGPFATAPLAAPIVRVYGFSVWADWFMRQPGSPLATASYVPVVTRHDWDAAPSGSVLIWDDRAWLPLDSALEGGASVLYRAPVTDRPVVVVLRR